jgi:uncharacterized membrane protein
MGSIDDARAILSSMMGAVATVLALIFSVALLLLSMVSTLFSPRLLYRFLQDWVTQTTIGLFMGTFVYICLVFLVTHQDPRSSLIPQISLITCWVLVMFSFRFLVYYCHRVARSIQNPDMIGAIVDDLYSAPRQEVRTSRALERTPARCRRSGCARSPRPGCGLAPGTNRARSASRRDLPLSFNFVNYRRRLFDLALSKDGIVGRSR